MEREESRRTVLEYLEGAARKYPDRCAVEDQFLRLSYQELMALSQKMGTAIARKTGLSKPIPILLEKGAMTVAAFYGTVYAGCFYVPISPQQSKERIKKITDELKAKVIVTDLAGKARLESMEFQGEILLVKDLIKERADKGMLAHIRKEQKGEDLLYVIYTSGSTGSPKGVAVSNQAVIGFIDEFTELFEIKFSDVIGNQAPFDFDVSVKDIYAASATGAALHVIPKELFAIPPRLLDHLCEYRVTTLIWAVPALCIISSMRGFEYKVPKDVHKVLFSGQAMPVKQLRIWQEALPEATFVNLYGPTEITCNCTYYMIDKMFGDQEKIPLGKEFPGKDIFLMDQDLKKIVSPNTPGEICVAGSSLSEGYYQNPEETRKSFLYLERKDAENARIYKTGDIGYYDAEGTLYFGGRRDFQIKRMGYRIELEEIENAISEVEEVSVCYCAFDRKKNRLCAFYMGSIDEKRLRKKVEDKLPSYMMPNQLNRMSRIPVTKNGKVDREYLLQTERYGS